MKKEEKREERQAKQNSFLHRDKSMNEEKTPTERERYYFLTDFSNGQILKTH